jgi:hypothetical protein
MCTCIVGARAPMKLCVRGFHPELRNPTGSNPPFSLRSAQTP